MLKKIAAAWLAAVLTTVMVQTPAQAVPACSSGYICFYDLNDGGGYQDSVLWSFRTKSVCYPFTGAENNSIGYINNNNPHQWYVFNNSDCTGTPGPIYPNSQGAMTGAGTWYNTISSIYRAT